MNCCGNTEKNKDMLEDGSVCPLCKRTGNIVKDITVRNMVYNEIIDRVNNDVYYLCMNEECDIVYYNNKAKINFTLKEIKVPVWYKKDASPKYVCYCNKVTENQVIDAVVKDGAKDMKDILKLTGAMKNGKCEINNPSGKCCHEVVQSAIDKGLSILQK